MRAQVASGAFQIGVVGFQNAGVALFERAVREGARPLGIASEMSERAASSR